MKKNIIKKIILFICIVLLGTPIIVQANPADTYGKNTPRDTNKDGKIDTNIHGTNNQVCDLVYWPSSGIYIHTGCSHSGRTASAEEIAAYKKKMQKEGNKGVINVYVPNVGVIKTNCEDAGKLATPKEIEEYGVQGLPSSSSETTESTSSSSASSSSDSGKVNGIFSEDQYAKTGTTQEKDWDKEIDAIDRDDLDLQSVDSLTQWENETEQQKITPVKIARKIVAAVGIIMIMWSILLYLSYWFDTINTIFPVSLVGILSFGKLEVLNEEETTWGMTLKERDGKPLTVNHRNMLVICIVLVAAGIFILSGSAYFLIQKLYSIAKHFYK